MLKGSPFGQFGPDDNGIDGKKKSDLNLESLSIGLYVRDHLFCLFL